MADRIQTLLCRLVPLVAVSLWGGVGSAQVIRPDSLPDTQTPVEELIKRLGADSFTVREQATIDLFRRNDLTLPQAEALLEREGLGAEQRLRLEQVALSAFARGPWAAVGIQFAPSESGGQRITDTVVGFDAARVLLPGDLIVAADGQPIYSQRALKAAILSRDPGGTMVMEIVRGGERSEVSFSLGSFSQLSSPMSPLPGDLLAAWSLRRSRSSGATPPDSIVPVPDVETMPEYQAPRGSPGWERVFDAGDAPRGLVLGGQPRESQDLSPRELASVEAARRDAIMGPSGDPLVQLAALRQQRNETISRIAAVQHQLEVAGVEGIALAQAQQRLNQLGARLQEIEAQIRELDAAIPERPKP
ncbi:MAG: PDZ domain-containing protein [Phycisphaerales bacterium]|nr:PDZ domain-containing protein [Phycisphaerales bacterium]